MEFNTFYKNNRIYKVPIVDNKGKKRSPEQKEKHSKFMSGRKLTQEQKNKISLSLKGRKRKPFSEEWKSNMSKGGKGKIMKPTSEETKQKISLAQKGRPRPNKMTIETRKKISIAKKGNKTHLWRGGVTSINHQIRNSFEYKIWRESVFKRDNYTCIWCNKRGVKLNADHIKPFAHYPELRFAIDNGRTLCEDCHKTTESYLNRWKKYD